MIIENKEELKKVRRELKELGYNIRTYSNSLGTFGEVFEISTKTIIFQIANREHYIKHNIMLEYFKKYKNSRGIYII